MLSLAEEQSQFIASLRDAELNAPLNIVHQQANGSSKRFDVYRNNVTVSLIESLGSAFPAIKTLVGEDFFNAVGKVFIQQHPPTSPLMYIYGQEFSAFLRYFEPAQSLPYLGDLADLEWNLLNSTHAADANSLAIDTLTQIDPERLGECHFGIHPSLYRGRANWQIALLWSKIRHDPSIDIAQIDLAQRYIIIRPELDTNLHIIPDDGAHFLDLMSEGLNLGVAAEKTLEEYPNFALGEHLGGLFSFGIVTDVKL